MTMLVFFIKKKDELLCLVQDYRNLNILIIKNKYLLFLISKLVTKLQGLWYLLSWTYTRASTMSVSSPVKSGILPSI